MGHFSNFRALARPENVTLLAQVRGERDPLRVASRLRAALGEDLGRLAAEQVALRTRARERIQGAEHLFFTRKGLEQASASLVAEERAARIAPAAGGAPVIDGSAGIGGDAMALVRAGTRLVALEPDEHTACVLTHNLSRVAESAEQRTGVGTAGDRPVHARRAPVPVVRARAEALALDDRPDGPLLLLDPDRRSAPGQTAAGQPPRSTSPRTRARRPQDWSPTFEVSLMLLRDARGGCLKLPASWTPRDLPSLAALGDRPRSLEWCSLAGEAKELRLWTGVLAAAGEASRCEDPRELPRHVVALGRDGAAERYGATSRAPETAPPGQAALAALPLDELEGLVELDPTLVHAELTLPFAARHGLRPLSATAPAFAYFGLDERGVGSAPGTSGTSLLARSWRVVDRCPLDRRRARELCRTHGLTACTLKTRGLERSAEDLARDLGLPRGARGPRAKKGLLIALGRPEGRRLFLVEPRA